MTEEELIKKIDDLEEQNKASIAKTKELEAKIPTPPPVADPDADFKPKTWKDLHDTVDAKAEAAALKVIQEAKKKEDDERKRQEDDLAEQSKKIEDTLKKLEEEKIIEPTKEVTDLGGRQRQQILGALVSLGGQNIDNAVKLAKSAWDQGYELIFDKSDGKVTLVRAGFAPSPNRDQFVATSAGQAPAASTPGTIDIKGVRGDLDEAARRWEKLNGKV